MSRIAVVTFNLGGPDTPEAVEPFLFNLFFDPAIIEAPTLIRWPLAKMISKRRAPIAREIYAQIGGGSPLLPLTEEQTAALKAELAGKDEVEVFIAMRYWNPRCRETVRAVKAFDPEEIVLLPLYPHYSRTTSGSSIMEWHSEARRAGIRARTRTVCCYPVEAGWIAAQVRLIREGLEKARVFGPPRVLFSAHGLPRKVIDSGDPYAWQIERTAEAVVSGLDIADLDWTVCYQSRVGPLEWIGPSTDDEIRRAGADGVPLVVVPIAFVSEHSETLVELDIEYGHLAKESGVPGYVRVPAVGAAPEFIAGLGRLVRGALARMEAVGSQGGGRACNMELNGCPCVR